MYLVSYFTPGLCRISMGLFPSARVQEYACSGLYLVVDPGAGTAQSRTHRFFHCCDHEVAKTNCRVSPIPRIEAVVTDVSQAQESAKVELWVTCTPYKMGTNGETEYESEYCLGKAHKSLIRHFSSRWDRELAENEHANRIYVPLSKEPVKLAVGWMVADGSNHIGTMAVSDSTYHRENLEILKGLAVYLEIGPLIKRVTNDIAAIERTLAT